MIVKTHPPPREITYSFGDDILGMAEVSVLMGEFTDVTIRNIALRESGDGTLCVGADLRRLLSPEVWLDVVDAIQREWVKYRKSGLGKR
jgi:hypothetical protein